MGNSLSNGYKGFMPAAPLTPANDADERLKKLEELFARLEVDDGRSDKNTVSQASIPRFSPSTTVVDTIACRPVVPDGDCVYRPQPRNLPEVLDPLAALQSISPIVNEPKSELSKLRAEIQADWHDDMNSFSSRLCEVPRAAQASVSTSIAFRPLVETPKVEKPLPKKDQHVVQNGINGLLPLAGQTPANLVTKSELDVQLSQKDDVIRGFQAKQSQTDSIIAAKDKKLTSYELEIEDLKSQLKAAASKEQVLQDITAERNRLLQASRHGEEYAENRKTLLNALQIKEKTITDLTTKIREEVRKNGEKDGEIMLLQHQMQELRNKPDNVSFHRFRTCPLRN